MTPVLSGYLLVFFGGGMGAMLRHGVNRLGVVLQAGFPYHTLIVNVLGCLVMGMLAAWFAYRGEDTTQQARLLLATGVLGGFTTFSAFSLDAANLWQRGEAAPALLYVGSSVVLSLAAVFAGLATMRHILN